MRIAFFSHYFTPEIGAPSARILEMSREWVATGNQVSVVTCYPNHPVGRIYPGYKPGLYFRENLDGIDVHRHWTWVTPNRGFVKKTLGHISYYPSSLALSNRRIPRPDVAIGSSPTFFAAMSAAALARRHGIPFVMEVRDLWPAIFTELGVLTNRAMIRLLEAWELSLYRRAALVVTVTESFRRNLIDRGIPAGKVATVYNGADVDFWRETEVPAELESELGLGGKKVVLYLGAHGISHALGAVLESARLLASRDDIRFVLVGEGAEKEALMARAGEMNLGNVVFLDPVDKPRARQLYSRASACLVPLRKVPLFDTFVPSKMFEILAMSRPVVASVRGEAAEILERSGGAAVVQPEDSAAIAREVVALCDNEEAARQLGIRGRRFVEEHFSRRALAARYLSLLPGRTNKSR